MNLVIRFLDGASFRAAEAATVLAAGGNNFTQLSAGRLRVGSWIAVDGSLPVTSIGTLNSLRMVMVQGIEIDQSETPPEVTAVVGPTRRILPRPAMPEAPPHGAPAH